MDVAIRPLNQSELPEADRIFRLAFGTFLGLPDPHKFMGDADLVATRWRTNPTGSFGAYQGDTLVGSIFGAVWGAFGFLGPLTVRPDLWDRGIGRKLMDAIMGFFAKEEIRQVALFTFSHSPKHIALYQKFGFWPQYLTPVMAKPIGQANGAGAWTTFSGASVNGRDACLAGCREITDAIFAGLDVGNEIRSVADQDLGDTVLIHDGGRLAAFAVCHVGAGSEAGSGAAYVKFGAVRPGPDAGPLFDRLLSACEALARTHGAGQLMAGVNTARHDAYQRMLGRGFRTVFGGVAMQRPNEPGYNRADCHVIDDLR